jgi:hypothetical protein
MRNAHSRVDIVHDTTGRVKYIPMESKSIRTHLGGVKVGGGTTKKQK